MFLRRLLVQVKRSAPAPYLALLLGLVATLWAWRETRDAEQSLARAQFATQVANIAEGIEHGLAIREQLLRGAQGLFASTEHLSRDTWRRYVASLDLVKYSPGVLALTILPRVTAGDLPDHLRRMRADGAPDYTVRPPGERSEYFPVAFIEPLSAANANVLGFDLYSEPIRHAALDLARDSGQVAVSGKLVLARDSPEGAQTSVVVVAPLYASDMSLRSVDERRAALQGFVSSGFRIREVVAAILGSQRLPLNLRIYDGDSMIPESLLFEDVEVKPGVAPGGKGSFVTTRVIPVGGRKWTLGFSSRSGSGKYVNWTESSYVIVVGVLLSLLLFAQLFSLSHSRNRAVTLARDVGRRLKENEERYALALQGTSEGLWDWNIVTGEAHYSPRWKEQIGYRDSEIGSNFSELESRVHPDDLARVQEALLQHLDAAAPYLIEYRLRARDNTYRWMRARGNAVRDANGRPVRMSGSHLDITDYKAQQQHIESLNAELEARVAQRTAQLAGANADLQREVAERRRAERELKQLNQTLSASMAKMESHTQDITRLGELGDLLHTCQSVDEVYEVMKRYAPDMFKGTQGGLFMITPSRNLVDGAAHWGQLPIEDQVFAPEDCWALRRGKVNLVAAGEGGLRCRHVSGAGPQSALCIPLAAQGETMGILHLRTPDHEPAARELTDMAHLAEAVAEHVGLALATLQLRDTLRMQSIRDPLTGLFNRRFMEETMQREERRAMRAGSSIGVIMLDIDHFKSLNDRHGHAAGDLYLRGLAEVLTHNIREGDIPCRYGGEEFTVIMPGASLEATADRAERIRDAFSACRLTLQGAELPALTLSAGVAAFPRHGTSWEQVLSRADQSLYKAKQTGRNRVVTPG